MYFKFSNAQLGVTDMSRRRRDHARDSIAYLCHETSVLHKKYAQNTTEYWNLNWSVASQFHADANPSHYKRTCDIFQSFMHHLSLFIALPN